MIFSNSLDRLPMNTTLDGTVLEIVSSTKFLGLTIYNKLSWNPILIAYNAVEYHKT